LSDLSQLSLINFYTVATHALIRAELAGRVPTRFTGDGIKRWEQFANELTHSDLLDLIVQDTAIAYPVPFGLIDKFDNSGKKPDTKSAEDIIQDALASRNLSQESYLRKQAERLGIQLADSSISNALPDPEPHHRILELPGSGGWLTYLMVTQPESRVYLLENFQISCGSLYEVMLIGLIAFELNTPPNQPLPVVQDPSLGDVLQPGQRYDWIIGLKSIHANKALDTFVTDSERVVLI